MWNHVFNPTSQVIETVITTKCVQPAGTACWLILTAASRQQQGREEESLSVSLSLRSIHHRPTPDVKKQPLMSAPLSPMIMTREPLPLLCAVSALIALGVSTTAVAFTRTDVDLLLHRLIVLLALQLTIGCTLLLRVLLLLHTTGCATWKVRKHVLCAIGK